MESFGAVHSIAFAQAEVDFIPAPTVRFGGKLSSRMRFRALIGLQVHAPRGFGGDAIPNSAVRLPFAGDVSNRGGEQFPPPQ